MAPQKCVELPPARQQSGSGCAWTGPRAATHRRPGAPVDRLAPPLGAIGGGQLVTRYPGPARLGPVIRGSRGRPPRRRPGRGRRRGRRRRGRRVPHVDTRGELEGSFPPEPRAGSAAGRQRCQGRGAGGRGPLVTVVAGAGARQGTGSASSAPTRRRHRLRRERWSAGRDRRPRPARIEPRSSLGPPPRRAPESPCNGIIQQDPPGSRNPSRSPALRRNASI